MSAIILPPKPSVRRIACGHCGTAFDCGTGGEDGRCWCAQESFRMPMPTAPADDCLCPKCLRTIAAKGQHA